MRVLVACEYSGRVRNAFREHGHEAFSCDLLPSEDNSEFHLQQDVTELLDQGWDLMIAHPPCTYLTVSGLHWNKRRPGRAELTEEAIDFVMKLANAPIPRIAIENPIGILSTRWRKPDQTIQPHQFGEDASKATCLWLKNLPPLVPTLHIPPRLVPNPKTGKPMKRWANQTDSGQNRLPPSEDRWKDRSRTYEGVAKAFADQWSNL